ncbi:C40 family peptidase [Mycobacterium talmoniae]|uniref:Peptidoglycan endopeptidase RipA n=1 Tax=Mycobacterium talmoniae TaxID=1858794 RepID=A0A1S1N6W6_9MYCO|nr:MULTISPECIES: NlpC/P60 family protein [Mycobacterium]OHU96887.1 hypothetical protein BKN37_22605 [Mycobacterium talmoniae]PQM45649.1 Peptidoglycan endopeptidase RipA [Mycobacterium talmoniae]TDH47202.1 hypothetical protein E2F47_26715 [Mycobacterium eburneum]
MAELTPDDVRHWDLSVIHQMFETVGKLRGSHHELGEALVNGHKRTANWHGEAAEAFREELGKTRTDVDAIGRESDGVYNAVRTAEMWVSGCKASLDDIDATAKGYGWKVTQDWKIDTSKNPPEIGFDDSMAVQQQLLQTELTKLKDHAQIADRDLALALRAAVGDAEVDARGHEVGGQQPQPGQEHPPRDAGSEHRPGVTDVNDPGVAWQPGFDPNKWRNSWHNPLLADNPPGYTGGPGPARDKAWQDYLAHFPTEKDPATGQIPRGFLPNPDAVNDPGLKVVGAAATQLGTSYAWSGGDTSGPGKGVLNRARDGTPIVDESWTYQDNKRVGFDCSGLAEYAAGQARPNVDIGGYTGTQLGSPNLTKIPSGASLTPGDFIFYGPDDARHVGIYIAPDVIINAPGSGLPVQVQERPTTIGPDQTDGVIRGRRLH